MTLEIIRQNIVTMDVDVIVNAANNNLYRGGGVCGAIFNSAGINELEKECQKIGFCDTGNSVITSGCNLKAKYIIHTVGPIYKDGKHHEAKLLQSCYQSSLELAQKYHLKSIAFPLISSGIYGYPKSEAFKIARDTIIKYGNDLKVYLVIYDKDTNIIAKSLHQAIDEYIDDNYVDEHFMMRYDSEPLEMDKSLMPSMSLDEVIQTTNQTFSVRLLNLIDKRQLKDSDVYHQANIDRKLFSKIRNDENYHPSKKTVIAFCMALQLTLDETIDLLECAGYSLSHSLKDDLIVEYFIINHNYDIYELNEALFSYGLATI